MTCAPTVPRLRVFAGPNGSGKSTIKDVLPLQWLGLYVNADEIEKVLRANGRLDLAEFGITTANAAALPDFMAGSRLLALAGLLPQAQHITVAGTSVQFGGAEVNSYYASVLADFIRHQLLAAGTSFTFETVMSSDDKIEFLRKAQDAGFRTYLYFVATEDPEINIARVQHRVRMGGHPVPHDKIVSRYHRSLDLLSQAVTFASRAYIFDNSGHERVWIAEVTDGRDLELHTDQLPHWFVDTSLWRSFLATDSESAEPGPPASA
ncbi:MAG: hypothetical protein RLY71_3804 [Pseudomonadota bacterium]|jgi:predicted ABC-type ATPase